MSTPSQEPTRDDARLGEIPEHDGGLVDGRALWADPALDDASWATIPG